MVYLPAFGTVLVLWCLSEALCAIAFSIGHATTSANFSQTALVRPPTPEWIHCTGSLAWVGNPPMTLGDWDEDCEWAFERMQSADIDPNWGLGNFFEFLPFAEQPTMGLQTVRVPRRYVFGNTKRASISQRVTANEIMRGGREMHIGNRDAGPGA